MNLLYIADNGFSYHNSKYYCTRPNYININQYKKYFTKVHVIARNSNYQKGAYELSSDSRVHLIKKNNFFELYRTMKLEKKYYDIVLMRNGINGCFASIFCSLIHKPAIAYCGADPYEFQRSKGTLVGKIIAPVWRCLERKKMSHSNFAQYCTEYLYKKYPTKSPALICSNVDISVDDNELELRKDYINRSHELNVIGMIGRLDEQKGIRTVIYALSLLGKKYRFEVIGGGSPNIFMKDIEKLNMGDKVKFLGYYSDKEKIKEWLRTIDVYVQPSLSEGLPRATIEAMSMACPCIATDIAGLPELLEYDYLIKPKDSDALAAKIKWLIENKNELLKAAEKNLKKAKEFDRKVCDQKLDDFYFNIVQKISNEVNK